MKIKKPLPLLALGLLCFASEALAQRPTNRATSGRGNTRASGTTGYEVPENIPLANNDVNANPSQKPLTIVVYCNATLVMKNVEAFVGRNNPPGVQDLVATETGRDRLSITFKVPWDWYYHIRITWQPMEGNTVTGGETIGMAQNMDCRNTAWWAD